MTHTSHEVNVNGSLYKQKVKFERSTMMKKLLVLTLVLGMAGLASAGLSFTKTSSTVASLGNDNTLAYNAYITVQNTLTATLAFTGNGNPGGTSTIEKDTTDYGDGLVWYFLTIASTDTTKPLLTGVQLTVTATAGAGQVQLWNAAGDTPVSDAITLVPEPVTMLLLGLGGLFIRRK